MRPSTYGPLAQIFVCANSRAKSDPLKSACGANGDPLFVALRRVVRERGMVASIWVTRTGCLGLCPAGGCAVAIYPHGGQWIDGVEKDAEAIVDHASSANGLRANR